MNRIKTLLQHKELIQIWLFKKLGKCYNAVDGYLQNRSQPSLGTLYQIASIFKIDAKELLVTKDIK